MKKRFVKRMIAALLAGVMTFSLAACGGSSGGDAGSSSEAADGDTIELTFLHIHGGAGEQAINKLCEDYSEQTNGKVHVTPIYVDGAYEGALEKLQTMALSGDLPSITEAGHQYAYFMTENMPVKYAQDFIDAEDYDVSDFYPTMLDLGRDEEGKLAGLPFGVSTAILYINKDLFEANGLDAEKDAPETFDEMRDLAKQLTHDGNYGAYIDYTITGNWEIQTMIEDMGGQMLTEDRSAMGCETQMQQTLEFLNTLVNEDKSMPLVTNDQAVEAFKAGKIGMYISSTADLKGIQNDSDFEIVTALHPTDGSGQKGAPAGGNSVYVLESTPEEEQASWEFVKYITSPEATAYVAQQFGYMVTRQSAYESQELMGDYLEENPAAAVTYEQVDWMTRWCNFPGDSGTKYVQIVQDGISAVLNRQKTVEEATQDIINDCNDIISGDA